jgi:hypothetical protein
MTSPPEPSTSATFEFDFRPEVRLITSTRTYLGDLCGHVICDPATTSRVALTAHEMLENVAKYSRGGKNSLEVELCRRDGRGFVQIRTKNRAATEQLERLRQLFSEMRRAPDAITFYDLAIARSVHSTGSGLGLARIVAEADMVLEFSISGDEVTISAEALLENEVVS